MKDIRSSTTDIYWKRMSQSLKDWLININISVVGKLPVAPHIFLARSSSFKEDFLSTIETTTTTATTQFVGIDISYNTIVVFKNKVAGTELFSVLRKFGSYYTPERQNTLACLK